MAFSREREEYCPRPGNWRRWEAHLLSGEDSDFLAAAITVSEINAAPVWPDEAVHDMGVQSLLSVLSRVQDPASGLLGKREFPLKVLKKSVDDLRLVPPDRGINVDMPDRPAGSAGGSAGDKLAKLPAKVDCGKETRRQVCTRCPSFRDNRCSASPRPPAPRFSPDNTAALDCADRQRCRVAQVGDGRFGGGMLGVGAGFAQRSRELDGRTGGAAKGGSHLGNGGNVDRRRYGGALLPDRVRQLQCRKYVAPSQRSATDTGGARRRIDRSQPSGVHGEGHHRIHAPALARAHHPSRGVPQGRGPLGQLGSFRLWRK